MVSPIIALSLMFSASAQVTHRPFPNEARCPAATMPPAPALYDSCRAAIETTGSEGCFAIGNAAFEVWTYCDYVRMLVVLVDNQASHTYANNNPAPEYIDWMKEQLEYYDDVSYGSYVIDPVFYDDDGGIADGDETNDVWFDWPAEATGFLPTSVYEKVWQRRGSNFTDFSDFNIIVTVNTKNYAELIGVCKPESRQILHDIDGDGDVRAADDSWEFRWQNQTFYIVTKNPDSAQTLLHEVGHGTKTDGVHTNLNHAMFQPFDKTLAKYGDSSDIMGSGLGHHSAAVKEYLGWLPGDNVTLVDVGTTETTATVSALEVPPDSGSALQQPYALKIPLPYSGTGTNYSYWVEVRRPLDNWDSNLQRNQAEGALVKRVKSTARPQVEARDGTPETSSRTLKDGALLPGRTFSDYQNNAHITVTATGPESADVYVYRGPATTTPPEVGTIAASSCGGSNCFTLAAPIVTVPSTPVSYWWSLDIEPNHLYVGEPDPDYASGRVVHHTFQGSGPWPVTLVVSDRRGSETWVGLTLHDDGTLDRYDYQNVTEVEPVRVWHMDYELQPNDLPGQFIAPWWAWSDGVDSVTSYERTPVRTHTQTDLSTTGPRFFDVDSSVRPFGWGEPDPSLVSTIPYEVSRQWTHAGDSPGAIPRSYPAMAYDEAREETVLFGGTNGTNALRDTWVWDGTTWERRGDECPNRPVRRKLAGMAYNPGSQQVVLYGGINMNNEFRDDTWTWDGTCWTKVATATQPGPLKQMGMASDHHGQGVFLLGGRDGSGPVPGFWWFDGSNWLPLPEGPEALAGAAVVETPDTDGDGPDRAELLVYGGAHPNDPANLETWTYDLADGTWTKISTSSSVPPYAVPKRRAAAAAAYDAAHDMVVVFGGRHYTALDVFGETQEWDGENWIDNSGDPALRPSDRKGAAMAWDSARGELVLAGGELQDDSLATDTWTSAQ